MSTVKKRVLEYSIAFVIGALLTFLIAIPLGLFADLQTMVEKYHDNYTNEVAKAFYILCNSSFIVGILTMCIGGIIFIDNGGFFDIIVYGMYRFFTLFNFRKHPNQVKYPTFYDYHLAQQEKPDTDFLFLIIIGAFDVALSMLFMLLCYKNNG